MSKGCKYRLMNLRDSLSMTIVKKSGGMGFLIGKLIAALGGLEVGFEPR